MFSKFRKSPRLPREVEEVFERAVTRLDAKPLRWKGIVLHFERRDTHHELNAADHLEVLDNIPANTPVDGMAIYLGARLGFPLPEDLALDLRAVRSWLRPRVLHTRVLEGPARSMCRRPAFTPVAADAPPLPPPAPDLITAVSIGAGRTATFVTTKGLDAWGLGFEDVLSLALDNLRALIGPDDLRGAEEDGGSEGTEGVHTLSDPTLETGASASLVLDHLLPELDPQTGALFAVPSDASTVVLPVRPGAGAKALASLVQVVYAIAADQDAPLSETIFWHRPAQGAGAPTVIAVPMTSVQENGARRVHLEAQGVVEDLLRVLGEID